MYRRIILLLLLSASVCFAGDSFIYHAHLQWDYKVIPQLHHYELDCDGDNSTNTVIPQMLCDRGGACREVSPDKWEYEGNVTARLINFGLQCRMRAVALDGNCSSWTESNVLEFIPENLRLMK